MYTLPEEYRDAGYCWDIAIFALILNVIALLGILMNGAVIWVTLKTKSLQSTVNFHLALGSFLEMLHQSGHLLFLYVAFSGQNFIQYWLAVNICSASLFGMGGVALCITFTAMDRLVYVLLPIFSRVMKPAIYLSVVSLIVLLFCSLNLAMYIATANKLPDLQVTGSIQDLMQGQGGDWYNTMSFVLNMLTLSIYIIIVVVIKCRKGTTAIAGRIFKSISVLVGINLSGFIMMRAYRLFLYPLVGEEEMLRWYITQSCSILLNISTASTGPILYTTSKDYRTAFQKNFSTIFSLFGPIESGQTNSKPIAVLRQNVVAISNNQQMNNFLS